MKLILRYLFFLICLPIVASTPIVYRLHSDVGSQVYVMIIPEDYIFADTIFAGGGEYGTTLIYKYIDSSMVYITDNMYLPNYNNIQEKNDSLSSLRLQNKELTITINETLEDNKLSVLPDTFMIEGLSKNSLYWKDFLINGVSCGYLNVSKDKKAIYDQVVNSFRTY